MLSKKIKEANILYHSTYGRRYESDQPYYKPENVRRVRGIIRELSGRTAGKRLLDIGCGTGFIMKIATGYFRQIIGIDITPGMLKQIKNRKMSYLCLADSEDMPFESNRFDVCVTHGFLHHLYNLEPTFNEIYRCLKKGGIYYNDEDPNFDYFNYFKNLNLKSINNKLIKEEADKVLHKKRVLKNEYGIDERLTALAEYQKIQKGGFKKDRIIGLLKKSGFSSIDFNYHWFLGQARVYHEQGEEASNIIDSYLKSISPASDFMFKYFNFTAVK